MTRQSLSPDPTLRARIVRALPLTYAAGADPAQDRPAHVRAASAMARAGRRLAVVQDDASFIALVDPATGLADAVALPAGEGGRRQFDDLRGNKRFKLDLEACVSVRDGGGEVLLAFGSGSLAARERIVVVRGIEGDAPEVRVVDASALYAALHAERGFSGSELNVEAAVVVGGALRLFNRGNGAPRDGRLPVDATCDLELAAVLAHLRDPSGAPVPAVTNVVQYEIGTIDGLRLSFTDAEALDGRIFFTAAAEDSPDATRDGRVAGSALGVLDAAGAGRWTPLLGEDGKPFDGKVEGVLLRDARSAWVLVDRDDPEAASELCEVELEGEWMGG